MEVRLSTSLPGSSYYWVVLDRLHFGVLFGGVNGRVEALLLGFVRVDCRGCWGRFGGCCGIKRRGRWFLGRGENWWGSIVLMSASCGQ